MCQKYSLAVPTKAQDSKDHCVWMDAHSFNITQTASVNNIARVFKTKKAKEHKSYGLWVGALNHENVTSPLMVQFTLNLSLCVAVYSNEREDKMKEQMCSMH